MKQLLILQTVSAKNTLHIVASEKIRQQFDIKMVNYADIRGFNGTIITTTADSVDLDTIDKIWLEFDWELQDYHINYHYITRLIIARYSHKLVVNKRTFQKYHPEYDDKLFVSTLLQYARLPHPATSLLSDSPTFSDDLSVIKKRFSGRARDVYLVQNARDLEDKVLQNSHEYIRQAYLDIAQELRVVVYRGAVVAAVEKSSKFKNGETGKVKMLDNQITLSTVQARLCVATALALESELVGIDLATDRRGVDWVIEMNIGADLTRFHQIVGVDLLEDLLLKPN